MDIRRLIYIFDPFCSWCYAMSPDIMRTYDAFHDQIEFGFITGGMMIGNQVRTIGDKKEYLITVKKNIEAESSVRFGNKIMNLIEDGSYVVNSHPPSVAIHAFHAFKPGHSFHFIHEVQALFYEQGKDIKEPDNYKEIVIKYDIDFETYIEALFGKNAQENATIDYQKARKFGITSFPTLLYQHNDQYGIGSAGYRDYNFLEKITTHLIKNPADIFEELPNK